MLKSKNNVSVGNLIILLLVILNAFIVKMAFIVNEKLYWVVLVTLPLLLIAIYMDYHKKRSV